MIVKADDGKFYRDPWIGVEGQWLIDIEESRKDDKLFVLALPRNKGEDRSLAMPTILPADIHKLCPIISTIVFPTKDTRGHVGDHNDLGRCATYVIRWKQDKGVAAPHKLIYRHYGVFDTLPDDTSVTMFCSKADWRNRGAH